MDEEVKVEQETQEQAQQTVVEKTNTEMSELISTKQQLFTPKIDETKSLKEQVKEVVDYAAANEAVKDGKFVDNLANLKKEELTTSAESSLKEEQVKGKEVEKKLQIADFGTYDGIANLIGLKKELPSKTLKVLMFLLQPLLIVFWVIFGGITGIINIIMDCVNSIMVRFAELAKPARKVLFFLIILGVVALVVFLTFYFLRKFGIEI